MSNKFNGSCGFTYDRNDFDIHENMRWVIGGILKILEHQFLPKLSEWSTFEDKQITIVYHNFGDLSKNDEVKACYSQKVNCPIEFRKINIKTPRKSNDDGATEYILIGETDLDQFLDLEEAMVSVNEGVPFAVPVYDISKIRSERVQEVRDLILGFYYEGLKAIEKEIGANPQVLDQAYMETKKEAWFLEKEVGDIVLSRGKNPSKAQLIARWEPDYIYHSAKLFKDDGSSEDLLFMVYWRMIGGAFFENPGRLSWMNSNTLKFIPKRNDDYRIAFEVDKGPIDFSYYYDPPRCRATKFYSHLSEAAQEEGTNTIRMNY